MVVSLSWNDNIQLKFKIKHCHVNVHMNRSIVLFSLLADVSHGKHAYPEINNETKFLHDGMLLAFWYSKIDFIYAFVLIFWFFVW